MGHPLTPSDPAKVTVIRNVTPNIVICSAPFWRFGRIKLGGRGTIVRLQPSGSLAVFSPTALTDEVKAKVASMGGQVKYIAALDFEHHIYLGPWHKEYPEAKVIGPEGLAEKRKSQKNEDVPFSVVYTPKNKDSTSVDSEFDSNFDVEYVESHANKELIFNYKPERTLIEADLIFNLPATEQFSKSGEAADGGIANKIFSAFANLKGDMTGHKRFLWYAMSKADRPSFNKSVAKISTWDFDRIIPCHGDVIETGGKGIYDTVMAWHLAAAKKTQA